MLVVDTPDGTHEVIKRYLNFHKHCSNIFWWQKLWSSLRWSYDL